MPTNDVENTNGNKQGKDILFADKSWTVPWGTERMLQENKWNKRSIIHWWTHPQGEQNKMKKYSDSMDWQQKGIRYGPTKLNNRVSQNVQDIRWSQSLSRILCKIGE